MSYFDVYRDFGYLIAEAMKIPRKYPDSKRTKKGLPDNSSRN